MSRVLCTVSCSVFGLFMENIISLTGGVQFLKFRTKDRSAYSTSVVHELCGLISSHEINKCNHFHQEQ